jgi:hypothetical protein
MWALLLAASAAVSPAPDLSWLSGYWLSCDGGREVSETWSDPRAGLMTGSSITLRKGRASYEFARIDRGDTGLIFHAMPSGQAPAQFALKTSGSQEILFENPAHDFPQRVMYRREGNVLHARIEGTMDGKIASMEWEYQLKPLNSRCG